MKKTKAGRTAIVIVGFVAGVLTVVLVSLAMKSC
jgi:hypothetical protein